MTEPGSTLTGTELDRAILVAMQEYTAARLSRDAERIAATRATLFALSALRDAQASG